MYDDSKVAAALGGVVRAVCLVKGPGGVVPVESLGESVLASYACELFCPTLSLESVRGVSYDSSGSLPL